MERPWTGTHQGRSELGRVFLGTQERAQRRLVESVGIFRVERENGWRGGVGIFCGVFDVEKGEAVREVRPGDSLHLDVIVDPLCEIKERDQ